MSGVEWSALAITDLETIDDYWSGYSEAAAERVADRIERAAAFLATMPNAGPALRTQEARKWSVAATRYVLVYRAIDSGIEVLRVYHNQQDWMADL